MTHERGVIVVNYSNGFSKSTIFVAETTPRFAFAVSFTAVFIYENIEIPVFKRKNRQVFLSKHIFLGEGEARRQYRICNYLPAILYLPIIGACNKNLFFVVLKI